MLICSRVCKLAGAYIAAGTDAAAAAIIAAGHAAACA